MNPIGAWMFFVALFKGAQAWDRRLTRRRALFDSFMLKVWRR
jgi:hypothetical protein